VRRASILFTSSLSTPFILEDLTLLRRIHDVRFLKTVGGAAPLRVLLRLRHSDLTYTWFASVYAFFVVLLARMAGKPSIVVIGGVDASRMPEIGYGIWLSRWRRPLVRYAVRSAWRVLLVDEALRPRLRELARYDGANMEVVPTGYDADFWTPAGMERQAVLTVATGCDRARYLAKGIDRFVDCAAQLPGVRFRIAGMGEEILRLAGRPVPPNLECLPFLEREALREAYRSASVYVQASRTEGLPNSLCEAMLCGCVPVGTMAGGIPGAIGDAGFLAVQEGGGAGLAAAVRAALQAPEEVRSKARARIAERFPIAGREKRLNEIIAGALS
jgi:glycosyltransferase involved in cell wall biosynthesis